jgi:hypothetical protein
MGKWINKFIIAVFILMLVFVTARSLSVIYEDNELLKTLRLSTELIVILGVGLGFLFMLVLGGIYVIDSILGREHGPLIKWLAKPGAPGEGGNATLTCKNGHTSRVYVDTISPNRKRKWGGGVDYWNVGIIRPEECPECGAPWRVPHKHGHKQDKPEICDSQENGQDEP